MMKSLLSAAAALCLLNGCVATTAIAVVGETTEAAVEVTGATAAATARVTGAVIGGTVDAVIPGKQGRKDED